MANSIDKICTKCGEHFACSKFTPYFDKCPECRKDPVKKQRSKRMAREHEQVCEFMRENPNFWGRYQVPGNDPHREEGAYWIIKQGFYRQTMSYEVYHWGTFIGEMWGFNLKSMIAEAEHCA